MRKTVVLVAMTMAITSIGVRAGDGDAPGDDVFAQPDTMLREIYSAVSSEVGSEPDWDRVRSFFHPEAVIVLRSSPDSTRVLGVNEFIQDFKDFYQRIDTSETTFEETVISLEVTPYGNIAYGQVVFEAAVTPSDRPPQRGLDAWHLVKQDGRWWFVSVVNENERVAGPFPYGVPAD